jgi:hypothetical protein
VCAHLGTILFTGTPDPPEVAPTAQAQKSFPWRATDGQGYVFSVSSTTDLVAVKLFSLDEAGVATQLVSVDATGLKSAQLTWTPMGADATLQVEVTFAAKGAGGIGALFNLV